MFIERWILVLLFFGYIWKVGSMALEIDRLKQERAQLWEQRRAMEERHGDELFNVEQCYMSEVSTLRDQISELRYRLD